MNPVGPVASLLLTPVAALYGLVVRARDRYYRRPGTAWHPGIPVISVGNLTVGGTGKTPLVAWLAARLLDTGRRPAIVSRGYGGSAGDGPLVVSTGDGPRVTAERSGDEPFLLARRVPEAVVIVGSDRRRSALAAAAEQADVLILDDGFQHRRLGRDLDIVLLDADSPFGNRRLLPAGRLREPLPALGRADVLLITRSRPEDAHPDIERVVRRYNARAPVLSAGHRALGFFDSRGQQAAAPGRALAFCGIGSPARFRADLEQLGLQLSDFVTFPDHHPYSEAEVRSLAQRADELGVPLVTTEKDLVRIEPRMSDRGGQGPLALRIETLVHESERLMECVRRVTAADGT